MALHDAHVAAYDEWIEAEQEYAAALQDEREYYDSVQYYEDEE
jgi:hypothetical protein